jgi:hypothetical protein
MKVYQAINAVQSELAKIGISKDSRNSQGAGYNFRGIDAVYNVLSSIMANNGLCIIPRMLTRNCEERTSKSGGNLFYVTVEAEFDLVSAEDGSKHTARTFGEAMDSGDKATNKAMSAAYKYMAFQTFAIPTEGDNDADNHTHEIVRTQVASSTMQALIADIAACTTEDELKDAYFHAISKAGNDQAAKTAIIKAKDAKKGELS